MNKDSIWIGEKDLNRDEAFLSTVDQEFGAAEVMAQSDSLVEKESNRRDFLKFLGFGLGAATVAAGCDIPVKRAIPYVIKPDHIVPGVATYYASSFVDGGDYCPILVKCREGRPIKIEGNDMSSMTKGGTSARAQAAVLGLYDINRYRGPMMIDGDGFAGSSWDDTDKAIMAKLAASKNIRIVTNTILSPTAKQVLEDFKARYPQTQVATYDPVSAAALLEANDLSFGDRVVPGYRFDKADVIVSFNADFLGTWISPVEYAADYIKGRKVNADKPRMSRHIQVESHMSMTGSNADQRVLIKPSELGASIAYLHGKLVGGSGGSGLNDAAKAALNKVAGELKAAAGRSLVVSASNNVNEQILVNAINNELGNYGNTLGFSDASYQRQGDERQVDKLINEISGGRVDTVIVWGANPAYDFYNAAGFAEAMTKVENKIALAYQPNETTALCNAIAPTHHLLESWGDAQPKRGQLSLIQPTIHPLFNTRQAEASLLKWTGGSDNYESYLKNNWKQTAFSSQDAFSTFGSFWDSALHDGVVSGGYGGGSGGGFNVDVSLAARKISAPAGNDALEVVFFEPVSIGNGQYSTNPWLQEMPDPVARTSWGNYLAIPVGYDGGKKFVGMNKLKDGDMAEVKIGDKVMKVPVIQQFGMAPNTIGLALGNGRRSAGKCGTGVGVDVNDCLTVESGLSQYYNTNVELSSKIGEEEHYSCVQYLSLIHI